MAQDRNSIWCFGDSAGIDFTNLGNPVPFHSAMDGRGTCTSVSDSNGNLLFNTYTRANQLGNRTIVLDKSFQIMQGGDSLVGESWYHENIIIPIPGSASLYYVFSIGVIGSSQYGLYYSIIDLNLNGGLGAVTIQNVQLSPLYAFDGLSAVKHGNGRDWWLIFKPSGPGPANNEFYVYLITPSGISAPNITPMGEIINNNAGCISFSKTGNKLLVTTLNNLIEVCDFDRCTGMFNNIIVIEPENVSGQAGGHFASCFSPSGMIIYLTHIPIFLSDTIHYVYQYDLLSSNIAASRDTIHYSYFPNVLSGLRLAPNNKVYISSYYECGGGCFPYPDSVYNNYNMNLSVINSPDLLGSACDYQPNSFFLGGKRSYAALPNNPEYELGPEIGSICDSLFLDVPTSKNKTQYNIYPNPFYNKITFLTSSNSFTSLLMEIFNSSGEIIYRKNSTSYLQEIDLSELAKGVYFFRIYEREDIIVKKIVKL